MNAALHVSLTVRDLQPPDVDDLDWLGPAGQTSLGRAIERSWLGEAVVLGIELPNGRLLGVGRAWLEESYGHLRQLHVHPAWQSLGVGTLLVGELERRIVEAGLERARLEVEHDNPRARELYERLGYRADGSIVESWPEGAATYVTVSTVMVKDLPADARTLDR